MISLYTGTPGSGKSYHMTYRIYNALRNHDINIICNYPINLDACALTGIGWLKRCLHDRYGFEFQEYNKQQLKGRFYYWDNAQITVENLLLFAKRNHTRQVRHVDRPQTIVFLDEAGIIFNCRGYAETFRSTWTTFFAKHRHYNYEIVLGCQFDRQIDRQIRACVEYEWKHRKLSNFKLGGKLLALIARGELFLTFQSWYATRDKTGMGRDLLRFSQRVAALYDTMAEFDAQLGASEHGERPAGCADVDGDTGDPSEAAQPEGAANARCSLLTRLFRMRKKGGKENVQTGDVPAAGDADDFDDGDPAAGEGDRGC